MICLKLRMCHLRWLLADINNAVVTIAFYCYKKVQFSLSINDRTTKVVHENRFIWATVILHKLLCNDCPASDFICCKCIIALLSNFNEIYQAVLGLTQSLSCLAECWLTGLWLMFTPLLVFFFLVHELFITADRTVNACDRWNKSLS